MFGTVARLLQPQPARYARSVASALLRDGFDLRSLDEMQTLGSFTQSSRIFRILAEQRLRPVEAAEAIRMASHLYQQQRRLAEACGGEPPREAQFLELLLEAARALRMGR